MKKLKLLIFTIFISIVSGFGQEQEYCRCSDVFEEAIKMVQENYIVHARMKLNNELSEYNSLIESYRSKVKRVESSVCTKYITEFLDYFNDGHLTVIEKPRYDSMHLVSIKAFIKKI